MNTHADLIQLLFEAYPNTKGVTENTVAIYAMTLSDIPVEQLQDVIVQCIAEKTFLPRVAEVREMYHALTTDSLEGDAEEGWLSVKTAIRGVGYTATPTFRDPLTAKTVETLGWRELCMSDNQVADRAHFIKIYNGFKERKASVRRLLPGARAMLEEAAPAKMAKMRELIMIASGND